MTVSPHRSTAREDPYTAINPQKLAGRPASPRRIAYPAVIPAGAAMKRHGPLSGAYPDNPGLIDIIERNIDTMAEVRARRLRRDGLGRAGTQPLSPGSAVPSSTPCQTPC